MSVLIFLFGHVNHYEFMVYSKNVFITDMDGVMNYRILDQLGCYQ